jgi:uncharacterized delta-60 repeat protein
LARYTADATLDTTFSGNGKVTTVIGDVDSAHAYAVALQSDGKIVAAGKTEVGGEIRFALARYNPDGTLDDTFGGDGTVTTPLGDIGAEAYGVAIQSNDKIVAAGRAWVNGQYRFVLARYRPNGELDTTFGGDGKVTTGFGGNAGAGAIALQSDGKIVVAGYKQDPGAFALARYDTDGTLDTNFGDHGQMTTSNGSRAGAGGLALQSDGKIVLAGSAFFNHRSRFVLARYDSGGALDTTFSGNGLLTTAFGSGTASGASDVAITSTGRIVAAGGVHTLSPTTTHDKFGVARYLGE